MGSRVSNPLQSKTPNMEVEDEQPQAVCAEVKILSPEEEQAEIIRNVVNFLQAMLVEDSPDEKSCFVGSAVPGIALLDYVERLVRYANQWAEEKPSKASAGVRCLMFAVDYLQRANARLTPRSVHRYLMTAVLAAIKFTEDFAISNQFWGDVGGCKLDDVNRMEVSFALALNWSFRPSDESYQAVQIGRAHV